MKIPILYRYITKEYLKIFFLCLMAIIAIYIIVDFFDRADKLLKPNVSGITIFKYYLLKMPIIVSQTLPVIVLLSTVITLGIMSKNNEILAMKATGISIIKILIPIYLLAFFISITSLFANENIVPFCFKKMEYLWVVDIKHDKRGTFFKNNRIWYKSGRTLNNIQVYYPERKTIQGIIIYKLGDDFYLKERIEADKGIWNGKRWKFFSVNLWKFGKKGVTFFEHKKWAFLPFSITPKVLNRVKERTEEMSFSCLKRYIKKIKREGYDPTPYLVDLHAKIAFPFVSLIVVLIAIPFGINIKKAGGIALALAGSLLLSGAFWLFFSIFISLGHTGLIPPIIAAWGANIIFGIIGVVISYKTRQ
ncbi:MAG: LPS export ABC transporter permease LptG [Deltaproteobacteria bacterium]|nr:MAG: LPS export ABC transporter permease LptG [Deltaproteobacteria bacterium]